MLTEKTPSVEVFQGNKFLLEDSKTHVISEEFDKNIGDVKPRNRGIWPISLFASQFGEISARDIWPLGIMKISDLQNTSSKDEAVRDFTRYDLHVIGFLAEVMFVLLQRYMQSAHQENDFQRLTHGIGANIDAAIKFAANIRDMLFLPESENHALRARFSMVDSNDMLKDVYTPDQVFYWLKDLEAFLEDMSFQFAKMQAVQYQKEPIANFHADVMMPALRMLPVIAAVSSKSPPYVSNLKARGSTNLPSVWGNKDGFISVFRNLFENSIKYSGGKTARVEMEFDVTASDVYIHYRDDGIGIPDRETEQIFVEGYRSVNARRASNRGIGVGLSYSRDVMRSLEGELECLPSERGAHFLLRVGRVRA